MECLRQKRFLEANEFSITKNGLKCIIKRPMKYNEFDIDFEQLLRKRIIYRKLQTPLPLLLLLSGAGICITILSYILDKHGSKYYDVLFWAVALLILTITSIIVTKKSVFLYVTHDTSNKTLSIPFFYGKTTKDDVDIFLKELFIKQKEFYIRKFVSAEFLDKVKINGNLLYMWRENIINDEEFSELKSTYLKEISTGKIGFTIRPSSN